MKRTYLYAFALGLAALTAVAQDGPPAGGPGGPQGGPGMGRGPRGGMPPMGSPLIRVIDANKDGTIDSTEIANASVALLTLDKNKDGKLTAEELIPTPPEGTNHFRGGPPPGAEKGAAGPRPPMGPLMQALDANKDGVLDSTEIANASVALLTLDANKDGKLTVDELRPKGGPGGQGGPGGRGGRGGMGGGQEGHGPGGPPPHGDDDDDDDD